MSRPPLSLLRRLHRALAYSVIDGLITKPVQVFSAETAPDDVLRAVTELVPVSATSVDPDLQYRAGAIAKYGILDLTYGIGSTALPIHRPGLRALRALGLVDHASDLEGLDAGQDFLHDLAVESEAGGLYLKVFLEAEERLRPQDSMRRLREGMPPGFWPHRFVVRDACLTSAHSIWIVRHFYL